MKPSLTTPIQSLPFEDSWFLSPSRHPTFLPPSFWSIVRGYLLGTSPSIVRARGSASHRVPLGNPAARSEADAIHVNGIGHTSEVSQVREAFKPRPSGGTEFSGRRCKLLPPQSRLRDGSWLEQVLVRICIPGASPWRSDPADLGRRGQCQAIALSCPLRSWEHWPPPSSPARSALMNAFP